MLLAPLLVRQYLWVIPIVLQIIAYFFLLRKMRLPTRFAILPFAAEWQLSKMLFRFKRAYWRPLVVTVVVVLAGLYINPFQGSSQVSAKLLILLAILVYGSFLLRLYRRLTGCFYKGIGKRTVMTILTWLLPPVGLLIMALGKQPYLGAPALKPRKKHGPVATFFLRAGLALVSAAEVLLLVAGVGFFTIREYPPRFVGEMMLSDFRKETADVSGIGKVVTREETMGDAYANLASMPTSREKYFPSHDQNENVVVIEYIIGSDLEQKAGMASANIAQMIDATKQGSNLTFVLECGGSERWFTNGIEDKTYGRYLIRDGKLEKVADLKDTLSMSTPDALSDFINWTRDNYPSDRYMLVLWDHGCGLSEGYGVDVVNKKDDSAIPTLKVSEIVDSVAQSNIHFDLIGFDACLMQDLDTAVALEPYADYYLASEETEGGFGWYYTAGFGKLAADPTLPTEEFGHEMVACYDDYNRALDSEGKANTQATLSLVDLTRAKALYAQMDSFFGKARDAIHKDSASFADLSLAAANSYAFMGDEQLDLIDFLTHLKDMDFDHSICSAEEYDAMITAARACVVYRNGDSAEGINGISLALPYSSTVAYTSIYKQMKALSFDTQNALYSDFFSIMAAQKKKALDEAVASGDLINVFKNAQDGTDEEWYVKGFENYETREALSDVPLTQVEGGYQIGLPEDAWKIIASSNMVAYQKTGEGTYRYLGTRPLTATDAAGHPMIAQDTSWIRIAGRLVCYESTGARETKEGIIHTGTVKATLNGGEDVTLYIEWEPVKEATDAPTQGHVVNYETASIQQLLGILGSVVNEDALDPAIHENLSGIINARARQQLQSGDRISFLFDYYDDRGNVVETSAFGRTVTVVKPENLLVTNEALDECDLVFGSALTDVYQRTMTTVQMEAHVG